jgi:hypothetical protein
VTAGVELLDPLEVFDEVEELLLDPEFEKLLLEPELLGVEELLLEPELLGVEELLLEPELLGVEELPLDALLTAVLSHQNNVSTDAFTVSYPSLLVLK